ncbi:MAG: ATP-binding cassette domain-containing protein, partial [Actinomycetota bacterium]|nr:ATP-binding cassette domain-containing protein [Actinomycetota bacterium]
MTCGLTKSFGTLEVLAGVDLWVGPGEVLALLGPSGCGKSTLLRVLAGFEEADGGVVELGGEPVRGPSPNRGMVAQAGTLFPWLSLRQNLGYGPRQAGRREVGGVVDDLVRATGLSGFDQALPRELS